MHRLNQADSRRLLPILSLGHRQCLKPASQHLSPLVWPVMRQRSNQFWLPAILGAISVALCGGIRAQIAAKQEPIKPPSLGSQLPVPAAGTNDYEGLKARAEKGDAEAQSDLGLRYSKGDGVPEDQGQAVTWFRKAAAQGFAKAQLNLGVSYAKGAGVPQDRAEAVKWWRKASEQDLATAQFILGVCYKKGEGVAQDYVEAAKWFRSAAEQGDAKAQYFLGLMYVSGEGVPKDSAEAVKWFRKAAEQGNAAAQYCLAQEYAGGGGVSRDRVEAYKWSSLAMAQAKPADFITVERMFGLGPERLPTINGITVRRGESALIKTPIGQVKIKCIEVDGNNVRVTIEGEAQPRTIVKGQPPGVFQNTLRLRTSLAGLMTSEQISEAQRRATAFATKGESLESKPKVPFSRPELPGGKGAAGTGFFVSDDGYLITCEHVVRGAASFHVKTTEGSIAAKLVKKDRAMDVALLKITGAFRAMPVAPEPRVKLGDSVFTIGFPNPAVQGVEPKLTRGEISSMAGIRDNPRHFQVSVQVQPGNSGGALVDERGNVVGVVTSRLNDLAAYESSGALPQNVNYAVKSEFLYGFLSAIPELSGKLKSPHTKSDREAASAAAERAAVLVIAE